MKKMMISLIAAAGMLVNVCAAGDADVGAARQILAKNQNAVIWVSAVLKTDVSGMGAMFGHGQEQKSEALGTVIDESGLTVVSLYMLDPMSLMADMMNFGAGTGSDEQKITPSSQMSDVKMRLADGKETAAKLIFRDPDLGLAFVIPEPKEGEQAVKPTYIPLEAGAMPEVMDQIVMLNRFGKTLNRQVAAQFARLSAIITKPRTFYTLTISEPSMGAPAFSADGKLLGICTLRKMKTDGGMMDMMSGMMGGGMTPVILPTADLKELAGQALAKKDVKEEKPAATSSPDEEVKEPSPAEK